MYHLDTEMYFVDLYYAVYEMYNDNQTNFLYLIRT